MLPHHLDEIDLTILRLLQEDGRLKRNQIAEVVGLSLPAVSERMRKLEERALIRGYRALVDPKRLGFDVTAFIRVSIMGSEHYDEFIRYATANAHVQELHSITGEGSHLLKIRVRNTSELERLLAEIQRVPGVRGTQTSIALSTLKETTSLPLEPAPTVTNGA